MFKLVSWHTLRIRLTIIQCFLIGPIGSFFNILKVRVLLTQPSVKYRYLHPRACIRTHINRNAGFNVNLIFKSRKTLITVAHIQILSHIPVCPICQSTSACSIWATCLGMARRRRRLECLPVACQNPELRDRLVLLSGLDDCQDCHFCTQRVSLHGDAPSVPAEREKEWGLFSINYTSSHLNVLFVPWIYNINGIEEPLLAFLPSHRICHNVLLTSNPVFSIYHSFRPFPI